MKVPRQLPETQVETEAVSAGGWLFIAVGIAVVPFALVCLACAIERKFGKPAKKQLQAVTMHIAEASEAH